MGPEVWERFMKQSRHGKGWRTAWERQGTAWEDFEKGLGRVPFLPFHSVVTNMLKNGYPLRFAKGLLCSA